MTTAATKEQPIPPIAHSSLPSTSRTTSDAELEAWLAGEVEKPCEIRSTALTVFGWRCPNLADWLMGIRMSCACESRRHLYACTYHKELSTDARTAFECPLCAAPIKITWTELIR